MALDQTLIRLLSATSPPGNEHPVRDILIEALRPLGEVHTTRWTGFYVTLTGAKPGQPDLVLTAHMDSPGFIVKSIQDDGALEVIHLGGINPDNAQLRKVNLRTKAGERAAVISVSEKGGHHSVYRAFCGFNSAEEASAAGVQIGDSLAWAGDVTELAGGYLAATHCDNRIGCFLLLRCAQALASMNLPFNIHIVATGCEEVGGRGARIMAQMIKPELAICFDTTYAEGPVKMGQGPALTLSDDSVLLPACLRDQIQKIAKEAELPLQLEVYNYAGTDASGFRDAPGGCLTICPLVPSLNNHTALEIIQLEDIESTQALAVELIRRSQELRAW